MDSGDVVEANSKGQKRLPERILFDSEKQSSCQKQDDRNTNYQPNSLFLWIVFAHFYRKTISENRIPQSLTCSHRLTRETATVKIEESSHHRVLGSAKLVRGALHDDLTLE